MEYPTLFTAGTRWLIDPRVTIPEGVAVHEAGHQFWYGMVGNNEFEDAWMDEGFNQFSTARAVAQAYDPNYLALRYFGGIVPYVFRDIVLSRETAGNGLRGYRLAAKADAQSTPSFKFFPGGSAVITYNKTGLWLNTMERWLGWPTLQRIMSTHFSRWKFKHPRPQDFFDVASEVSGQDLRWYFDQVYRSSNVFDYGVQDLRSVAEGGHYRTTVVCAGSAKRSSRWTRSSPSKAESRSPSTGTVRIDGRSTPMIVRRRRCRPRSIPIACCCSTSTPRTTRRRWSPRDLRRQRNGP